MILNTIQNRRKILGINERNLSYVARYNSDEAKAVADDKLRTKEVLEAAEIPTTRTLAIIRSQRHLDAFDFHALPKSFVIKPVAGVEGGGIEIIFNRDKFGNYVCGQSSKLTEEQLRIHISHILEGRFSHSYTPDIVLIEERVQPHHKFRPFIYKGTPDIRILVFRGIPTMAMIRWPTRESQGKANLSKGAVGSGIDIATGVTTHSLQEDASGKIHTIEFVHESHTRYSGFKIPYWEKMLMSAVKAARASGLGFCAVDFLIDRDHGPLIVELNARIGLRMQVTNQDGLKWRLEQIKSIPVKSDAHAIRLGKDLFGGEVEEEIEAIAGKKLISLIQSVKLYHKKTKAPVIVKAKVDTGAGFASIDTKLARELGYGKVIKDLEQFEIPSSFKTSEEARAFAQMIEQKLMDENADVVNTHIIKNANGITLRVAVMLKAKIEGQYFDIEVNIKDRSHLEYPMLLGARVLKNFLIDPSRK